MRIDELTVDNFNGFDHRTFTFDPHFNLLVGDNATGKTSVLDALAVSIGSWFLGMRGIERSPGIEPQNVRVVAQPALNGYHTFEKQFPARIECTGVVMGRPISWARELRREGVRTTTTDAKAVIELAGEAERQVRAGEGITLPLICTYGTGRLRSERGRHSRNGDASSRRKPSRFDGYRDCLDSTAHEAELIAWVRDETMASGQLKSDTVALRVLKGAIGACVEGAESVYYDARYKDLVVLLDGFGSQYFHNLSDGQRIMLTLIGDLATRAAKLNPHLGDSVLRETPGVVLIDELDLHLHPKWQRRVIHDLKRTFPSLQFITTTHSPQLVGEAEPEEIRLLDADETSIPARSFGIDSSRILEEVMGASSRDESTQDLLNHLFKSIDDEQFDLAGSLLAEVEAKLGPDDPEVTRARALMTFLESKI